MSAPQGTVFTTSIDHETTLANLRAEIAKHAPYWLYLKRYEDCTDARKFGALLADRFPELEVTTTANGGLLAREATR